MIELLQGLTAWHWLVFGVVLLVIELTIGTTYILWPAVSAIAVGVLLFIAPGMGWELQMLLFFLLSVATLVLGRSHFQRFVRGGESADLNDPTVTLVGRQVRAVGDFTGTEGRVELGDTQWGARLEEAGDMPVAADTLLYVRAVRGATLVVGKAPGAG